jgi:hypothetical protein
MPSSFCYGAGNKLALDSISVISTFCHCCPIKNNVFPVAWLVGLTATRGVSGISFVQVFLVFLPFCSLGFLLFVHCFRRFCCDSNVTPGVSVGVGMPLAKRCIAGIWPAIGVRSGPIGGHGSSPHHDGLVVRYKLFGMLCSEIVLSQTTCLCTASQLPCRRILAVTLRSSS